MFDIYFLQQLVIGLSIGMTYALVAIGFTLVYRVLTAVNFAHGEIYTLGAFAALIAIVSLNPPLWAVVLCVVAAGAVSGFALERIAFRPFRRFTDEASLKSRAVREATLLSSLAIGIVIREVIDRFYHGQYQTIPEHYMLNRPLRLGGLVLSSGEATIIVASVALMVALQLLLFRTRTGIAIRAVANNLIGAQLSGININRIIVATFVVGSILGAVAGLLVALAYGSVYSYMGLNAVIKAFVAMVMGGLTNIPGAVAAGLLLGVTESIAGEFVASAWTDMVAYVFLLVTLVFFPKGIFAWKR